MMLNSIMIISFRKPVLFFFFHFNFFSFSTRRHHQSLRPLHTMINKFGYADAKMLISGTGLPYHQILLRTTVSIGPRWSESLADELSENPLTFRSSFSFLCTSLLRKFFLMIYTLKSDVELLLRLLMLIKWDSTLM